MALQTHACLDRARAQIQAEFRQQLKVFELPNVEFTGEKLGGGHGSYGYVEIVRIPGARCAAKILHEQLVQGVLELNQTREHPDYRPRSMIEAFKTECTLMSDIRHPNIVQFFGICYPANATSPALVMELLMKSLHDFLEEEMKRKQVIPLSLKIEILQDISKGLVYLHSRDIVHRDLTAANVLLMESLTAKIADFGMARLMQLQQVARMTTTPGNPDYMPPEAVGGNQYAAVYGKSIDSFSMGHIILFTTTQECPALLPPKRSDPVTGKLVALSEIERREISYQKVHNLIGGEHPLSQLAVRCLQDAPRERPLADEIMQQLNHIPTISCRTWIKCRYDLILDSVKQETQIKEQAEGYEQALLRLNEQNSRLQKKCSEEKMKNSTLSYEIHNCQAFSQNLKKANSILSYKVQESRASINQLKRENAKLSEDVESFQIKCQELILERQTLAKELHHLKESKGQNSECTATVTSIQSYCSLEQLAWSNPTYKTPGSQPNPQSPNPQSASYMRPNEWNRIGQQDFPILQQQSTPHNLHMPHQLSHYNQSQYQTQQDPPFNMNPHHQQPSNVSNTNPKVTPKLRQGKLQCAMSVELPAQSHKTPGPLQQQQLLSQQPEATSSIKKQESEPAYRNFHILSKPGQGCEQIKPENMQTETDNYDYNYVNLPLANQQNLYPQTTCDADNLQQQTLFSPPNTSNTPEPIVKSGSELERLGAIVQEADTSSLINARSDPIGYSSSLDSISLASPLDQSYNKQAEDAWKIDTSTNSVQTNQIGCNEVNVGDNTAVDQDSTDLDTGVRINNDPNMAALPGTWVCDYCTNLVDTSKILCDICDNPRVAAV